MPIAEVTNLGKYGVITDKPPHALPDEAWSAAQNMRFQAESVRLMPGDEALPSCDSDQRPYYLQPFSTATAYWWVQAGIKASAAYVCGYDGSSSRDVTPAGIAITPNDQWSGGVFNGVPVLHNGGTPYYWPNPNTGGTTYIDLPFDSGGSWAANGLAARVVRPFKNVLFALDVSKSGTRYPHMVKWSSAADPGYVPASWDHEDPTNISGETASLAQTNGFLVDMVPLGDLGLIYKEDSTWSVSLTSGTLVMKFREALQTVGALAPGCIAGLLNQHLVMGDGDIVLHNGQSAESAVDRRVRNHIFRNLDTDYYRSSFLVAHHQQSEVWVCYPTAGQQFPNQAAVWNWKENTWTIKDLPEDTSHLTTGVELAPPSAPASDFWDDQVGTWDSYDDQLWSERSFNTVIRTLVGASESGVRRHEQGVLVDGVQPAAYAERTGLAIGGHDTYTMIRRVYPRIAGAGTVYFYVAAQNEVDEPPSWQGPFPFEIGVDSFFNCRANGRLHGIRIETTETTTDLRFTGWKAEYTVTGMV